MRFADQHGAALPPKLRLAALGGVIGPAAFIGGWTVSAAITSDAYSSIDDAISRLAAIGADSRRVMTAGFIGFGIALPVYAMALRRAIGGKAWVTATAAGIATLAVAATPLDRSSVIDTVHAAAAGVGYIALAATPPLAARPLLRQGHRGLARFGVAAGAMSGISLILASSSLPTGFFQRLGLTAADLWIAASAVAIAHDDRGRRPTGVEGSAAARLGGGVRSSGLHLVTRLVRVSRSCAAATRRRPSPATWRFN